MSEIDNKNKMLTAGCLFSAVTSAFGKRSLELIFSTADNRQLFEQNKMLTAASVLLSVNHVIWPKMLLTHSRKFRDAKAISRI